jgi:hypothetical protein
MIVTNSIEIYCPNCGHSAERHYLKKKYLTRTQCVHCDYLMITCDRTGKVIEAYAPGYGIDVCYGRSAEARSCPQAASASRPRE